MPHVAISLYPGRSEEFKKEVSEKVKAFLETEGGFNHETVSVSLHEIDPSEFTQTINQSYKQEELYVSSNHIPVDKV